MLITILVVQHGQGPLVIRPPITMHRRARRMQRAISIHVVSSPMISLKQITTLQLHTVLQVQLPRPPRNPLPQPPLPSLQVLIQQLPGPVACQLVGKSVIHLRVDHITWITTHALRHGSTPVGKLSSGCWAPTAKTLLCNHKPFRNWVPYRLDGKCVSLPQRGCTLWTTTRRRRPGTTRDCRRLSIPMYHSTSVISGGNSSTSEVSLPCVPNLATARLKSGETTSLKTVMRR